MEKQRHQRILEILEEQHFASAVELSQRLDSSEATIRRDLKKLAKAQRLKKIRGGAEVLEASSVKPQQHRISGQSFLQSKEQNAKQKLRIAKQAVALCQDGESVIINGGSSTYMMGKFLNSRRLNILTNSFHLAQELVENSDNQVTLPGGEVYRRQGIILSAFDSDSIDRYSASKMFMGTPGINEQGVMESDPLLIRSEQKLRKQADQLIVLADSSKIGSKGNFVFEPLENVDVLITDHDADQQMLAKFRAAGIEVIQV